MFRLLIVLSLATMVSGCAWVNQEYRNYDQAHAIPPGSQLMLTRDLTIPANRRNLYLQSGQVHEGLFHVNTYYPFCQLILNNFSDTARTLKPDTFTVTSAHLETRNTALSLRQPRAIPVAFGLFAGSGPSNGGPSMELYATVINLHSAKQPHVRQMVCGWWMDPAQGEFLTMKNIRQALTPIFRLNRAPLPQ